VGSGLVFRANSGWPDRATDHYQPTRTAGRGRRANRRKASEGAGRKAWSRGRAAGQNQTHSTELHDTTQKVMQDEIMSREGRLGKVRSWRQKADKKIRETLNDDQKKKLDQLEQDPHAERNGGLSAARPR
jgi:hypothetical protein